MPTLDTLATYSTSVNEGAPTTNYANIGYTFCGWAPDFGGYSYAWMKFDISTIPAGATITSAFLYVNVYYTVSAYDIVTIEAQRATDLSILETMTYNTQPTGPSATITGSISYDVSINENSGEKSFTVTSDVQTSLAAGAVGWRLRTEFQDDGLDTYGVNFMDTSYPKNYPRLVVNYTAPARRRAHTVLFN